MGAGANAFGKKSAPATDTNATTTTPHTRSETGQRRFKSLVPVHTDCALPAARPVIGKSGDGFTVLVAAVMRLSQKTSSAFELVPAGFGFRGGGFLCAPPRVSPSDGSSREIVVGCSHNPESALRATASLGVAAICTCTLLRKPSRLKSMFSENGPTARTSPAVKASDW